RGPQGGQPQLRAAPRLRRVVHRLHRARAGRHRPAAGRRRHRRLHRGRDRRGRRAPARPGGAGLSRPSRGRWPGRATAGPGPRRDRGKPCSAGESGPSPVAVRHRGQENARSGRPGGRAAPGSPPPTRWEVTDMTSTPSGDGAPSGVDTTVAHSARVWNYWLGGKDNYPVDREAGEYVMQAYPEIVQAARADRAFLVRAVTHLVREEGVRQFLDVGTG